MQEMHLLKQSVNMHSVLVCLLCFLSLAHAQVLSIEKCVYDTLRINCPADGTIRIKEVLLGDSHSCSGSNCCPAADSCTHPPSDEHKNFVNNTCNGRTSCAVEVERRKIPCGSTIFWENNDFERIKYECIFPATTTTSSSSSPTSLSSTVTTATAVTTTSTHEVTTLSLLVVNESRPTVSPSDDDDDSNNNNNGTLVTQRVTTNDGGGGDADAHKRQNDNNDADDDGEETVVSVIIPIIVAIIVLIVIAIIVGYCVTRRKKRLAESKSSQGFSNPEYAAMNFRHLEQTQRQADSNGVTSCANRPPSPVYELESAIGRLSDAPLVPENEYSDVEDVRRSGGSMTDSPAGKKPAAACSDYCVPAECAMKPGDSPAYDSPASPAAHSPSVNQSPIYSNVDIEMQPCNAAGIYSEPKPWSEAAYESVGMRQQHPESEYVPFTANEEPRVSLPSPTTPNGQLNNSVYFNMGRQQSTETTP